MNHKETIEDRSALLTHMKLLCASIYLEPSSARLPAYTPSAAQSRIPLEQDLTSIFRAGQYSHRLIDIELPGSVTNLEVVGKPKRLTRGEERSPTGRDPVGSECIKTNSV